MNERAAQLGSNFLAVADTLADGQDTSIVFPLRTLRSATMASDEEAGAAAKYLVERGYACYGTQEDQLGLRFTRLGFAHIRRRMSEAPPAVPSPSHVTTITNSTVGAVQQGTTGSTQFVRQTIDLTPAEVLVVRGFLATARDEVDAIDLDSAGRTEVENLLDQLDAEVNSQTPDGGRVRRLLNGLTQIALGAAGSATWAGLQTVVEILG